MTTHRLALLLAVATLAAATPPAVAEDKKSWTGESVMHTRPPEEIKFSDRIVGKPTYFKFSGMLPILVREDREGRLLIHDGYTEGYVNKDDFVLTKSVS